LQSETEDPDRHHARVSRRRGQPAGALPQREDCGWGKAKAEKLMAEIGIAEDRRLKGLGENQIAKLIEALD